MPRNTSIKIILIKKLKNSQAEFLPIGHILNYNFNDVLMIVL